MTTAEYIAKWEGYISLAAFDVNAWRLGYGSDTEGPDQARVVQGMTTTRERALQNLALRIPQFEKTAVRATGADAWEKLADNQRTALLSLVYNYGRMPGSVARAILTGDPANVAAAIRTLQGANGGVNRKRRLGEAQFYLTGSEAPVAAKAMPHVVAAGGIVVSGGAIGGAIATAGQVPTWATILMSLGGSAVAIISAFNVKPKAVPVPPATVSPIIIVHPTSELDPLDDFMAALEELHACQLKVDAKRKVIVDKVEKYTHAIDSVDVKIIEHHPTIAEGK